MGEKVRTARARVNSDCQRLIPSMDSRRAGSHDDPTTVMAAMRSARKEQGLHQKDLALAAGYTREEVCRWEKGTRVPTVYQAADMASALGYRLVLLPDHWETP